MDSQSFAECKDCLGPAYCVYSKLNGKVSDEAKSIYNKLIKDFSPKMLFGKMLDDWKSRRDKNDIRSALRYADCESFQKSIG